jgi:hypothetical protein
MKKIDEIEKYLKKWPTWIGIVFLFVPGILYQLNNKGVDISSFQGLLVVVFLSLSLYYSIPYIILGFLSFSLTDLKRKKLEESDFLVISLLSLGSYAILNYMNNLTGFSLSSLWWGFLAILFVWMIILILVEAVKIKMEKIEISPPWPWMYWIRSGGKR